MRKDGNSFHSQLANRGTSAVDYWQMDTKFLLANPVEKTFLRKITIRISKRYRRELCIFNFCGVTPLSLEEWVQTIRKKATSSSSRTNT